MTLSFYLVAIDGIPQNPPIPAALPPTARQVVEVRGKSHKTFVRAYNAEQAAWRWFGWRVRSLRRSA